ncbi:MAG: hypothetical protein ACYCZH_03010 [Sulfuriferula sp.]
MNLPLSLVPCTSVPASIAFAGVGIGVGAAWQLVPSVPVIHMPPELVLFIFLPPLLTTTAYALPLRAFRRNLLLIALLAAGLVLTTTGVVAVIDHFRAELGGCTRSRRHPRSTQSGRRNRRGRQVRAVAPIGR